MERFFTKKIRRALGLIVCAALMVTAIFQNNALANAEGNGTGEGTQDNRFYLNGVTVTADHNPELLAGQVLTDGEHEYVLDAEGKIQFDEAFMTVSGGDAGNTPGGDVGSASGGSAGSTSGGNAGSTSGGDAGSVSGDPSGTDPNYFYIRSKQQQLELVFQETDEFFGLEPAVIIQPDKPEATYTIELIRKFKLAVPIVQLRSEDGGLTSLTPDSYSYSYTDIEDVTAPVRAGEYEAAVTWMGIPSGSISYDCTGDVIPVIEYRDYIVYGQNGDFYITTMENGQEKNVDVLEDGKNYAIQSIVIKGREKQDNENPFNYYRIVDAAGEVLAEGNVGAQDTAISNIADKSGSISIHMYIRDNEREHEASNAVTFAADNAAPELVELSYLTGAAQQNGEEPRKIELAPDGSLQFTEADTITDQDTIILYLTVSEPSGIKEAAISYIVNGEESVKTDTLAMTESGVERGVYSTAYTITGNVNLTQIQFTVTDILEHQAVWGTLSAIVDNIAPKVKEEEIRLTDQEGSEALEKDSRTIRQEAVTIEIPIFEENGLNDTSIQLSYQIDGVAADSAAYSLERIADEKGLYILSVPLKTNKSYTQFALTVTDRTGNYVSYTPGWEIILDNVNPNLEKVEWTADGETDSRQELDKDTKEEITAQQDIRLWVTVKDRNDIAQAALHYLKDGEIKGSVLGGVSTDSGTGLYDNRECVLEFILSGEGEYSGFELYLEDIAGNSMEEGFSWSAVIDNTPPQIHEVSWKPQSSSEWTDISEAALLVDQSEIMLTMKVEDKNIDKVELCLQESSGQNDTFSGAFQRVGDSTQFTLTVNPSSYPDRYNYKNLILRATDKSGNTTIFKDGDGKTIVLQILLDNKAPELQNLQQLYPKKDVWYHRQEGAIQYSFDIKDYSRIKSIQMIAEPKEGEQLTWDLMGDYREVSERNENGYYIYHITTDRSRFAAAADQDLRYYFVITDEWGNCLDTSAQKPEETAQMRIDNTAPSSAAYVKFAGDLDRFYDSLDELVDIDGKQYQYGSQSGNLFNNSQVELTVYVADLAAEDAVDQTASGVKQVRVTYRYTDTSVNAAKDQSRTLTYGEGSSDLAISRSVNVTANGKTTPMDAVSFTLTVTGSQRITAIDSIEITDHAGNVTVVKEYASANGLEVNYVLDNKAPELSHVIPGGSSGYNKDGNTYYYNSAVEMSVTIVENHFYPAEVSSSLRVGEADRTIAMSGFEDIGNYHYRSRFTLNDGDGRYRFSLSYADRSGNAMIFQGDGGEAYLSGGVYTSPILVLDTVAPYVSIRYYQGGNDITDSVYGGKCVGGDVLAVISITEDNFDPQLVQIAFSATDAADNHAYGIGYNPEGWSQSGNTYSYSISCAVEGRYSLSASCVDKAGNRSGSVPVSDFIVDRTAPVATISYDTTVENGYYNTDRVATVTVTEQNFNQETVDYVITSTGAQPGIAGWSHAAGNGCSEYGHVKSCRWSSQVVFAEDADYSFTFGCVDMAGNPSAPLEEQAFTIDQTLPVIQVSYDNNDSLNNYFYKEGRTATITVVEHNFVSSEVNLAVSSPDGDAHAPSVWRDTGADTHVCQIAYDTDGDYSFDISYVDPAGNEAEAYAGDSFVIDLTAPELEISGVNDRSANNGVVAPVITYSDKNYDAEQTEIRITGVSHGQISPEHTITVNDDGQTIAYMDFSHVQELDDLYTLEAVITDKAGNSTTDSILFSVNRFGSTYLFSRETQELLDRYYINQGPALNITEINVDTLEHQEISYSCDGNTVVLEQEADYTVQESGSEYEWKQYTYDIPGSNFDTEGVYVVTLQSVDRASNDVTNRIKEKNIEFIVDKTAPSVVLGGIENGGSYAETTRSLTIDAVDNIYLKSVEVYLNSQLAVSFDEDALAQFHGVVSYEIKETGSAQTVYVVARDAAGNETRTDAISFLISSNAFIRWFYNKPLFFGSIAAVAVVAGGIVFILLGKRKKKDERKAAN